jgi:hypothetical protein
VVYIPTENGIWVDENFERLARLIQDFYGPESASQTKLEFAWIPPEHRTTDDKYPYAVIDTFTREVVMYASELDTPEDILTRLFLGDTSKHDVLKELDARQDAQRALEMKEHMDRMEEAHDKAAFFVGSDRNYITMDGKRFDSDRRRVDSPRRHFT